jgi:CheY-like chemotaxis protein
MEFAAANRPVVLVVEDEPLIRMIAMETFADEGFEAVGAATADQAIRILESRDDIRVIFTDIKMPGSMDGLKLAHAVRGRWPPIEIIVTSAFRALNDSGLPAGGRFFQKPYDAWQVVGVIRELLAMRIPISNELTALSAAPIGSMLAGGKTHE